MESPKRDHLLQITNNNYNNNNKGKDDAEAKTFSPMIGCLKK